MFDLSIRAMLDYAELLFAAVTLVLMLSKAQAGKFPFLAGFLACRVVSGSALLLILLISAKFGEKALLYQYYFAIYWVSYSVEMLLGFGIIYSVFRHAMAPLKGLQSLGGLMFRWALGISLMVSITMGLSAHTSGSFLLKAILQLEQSESVLTLCMLLFVTLAIRPMGLSFSSKLFGVNLGLGVLAAADLVFTALASHTAMFQGAMPIINGVTVCVAFSIWIGYFAMPEPRRRMILLPTTSPFLRWNQISMALGDAPGFVAVGDVTLDMFAPAELEVMRRASVKMTAASAAAIVPSPLVNRVLSTSRELAEARRRLSSM